MLPKGNIKAQITTAIKHFSVNMKETNRRVEKKFIKTVCFMGRNKWAVKNKFEALMNHIRDLGDEDLKKHTAIMAKNATYMSHFTVDEMVKVICDYVEVKLLRDLLTAGDFLLLTDKRINQVELSFQFGGHVHQQTKRRICLHQKVEHFKHFQNFNERAGTDVHR